MTVNPISELSGLFAGNTYGGQNVSSVPTADNFQTYMDNASKGNDVPGIDAVVKNEVAKDLPVSSNNIQQDNKNDTKIEESQSSSESDNVSDNKTDNNKDGDSLSVDHKDVKDSNEKTEKVATELKDKIENEAAKELGISVEELEEILAQLGIQAADLCNKDNVSLLVATVKGDGDLMSIITDEASSDLVLELNSMISDFVGEAASELDLPIDEFKELFTEGNIVSAGDDNLSTNLESEEVPVLDVMSDIRQTVKQGDIETTIEPEENINDNVAVEDVSVKETEDASNNNEQSNNNAGNDKTKESLMSTENNYVAVDNVPSDNFDINSITQTENEVPVSTVDTEDVINQINEHIRLRVSNEVTELSMQLNPESLGTVNLNVAAREGQITATLITQNESVQAALEAQIAMIKESLELQGVKVEAIEVAVGSHGFEQNLEQGNDFNNQQEEVNSELRKATRKLNMGDILADGDLEDISEEDMITVDMMHADGNTMDYKV